MSGIVMDKAGTLYGTTNESGAYGNGVVFSLTPPAGGQTACTENVLYSFKGKTDGATPFNTPLVLDTTGIIYGATFAGGNTLAAGYSCGVILKLTPPATAASKWTESVLYRFKGNLDGCFPEGPLALTKEGVLYGATNGGGGSQNAGRGFGTVFELEPPASGHTVWTEAVLYRFKGGSDGSSPAGGLVTDGAGSFYGTTAFGGPSSGNNGNGWGTVFKLTP